MTPASDKTFAVSTLTKNKDNDDVWHTKSIDYDTAQNILVQNGWTKEQAVCDLAECPEKWIIVNKLTQIC